MPGLLDYGELIRRNTPKLMPPGVPGPWSTERPQFLDPRIQGLLTRGQLETGIRPPPPSAPQISQDQMRDLFTGRTGAEGDNPEVSERFNPFSKSQGQLAQGSPIPSPYAPDAVAAAPPPKFDATRFDPVPEQTVSPPLSRVAENVPLPPPRPAGGGLPATAPLPPTRAAAGLLGTNPLQTTAKPTGVPITSPSTDLVQAPLPPERPAELSGDGPLARNPAAGTAPTPMANPITPTSMLDNGMFNGGQDFGQGLGPVEFDSGLGDLGDFGAGDQGGGADFAGGGAGGDFGGGADGGGGGGLGGIGALFGAIGKMAGGGGGGGGGGSAPKLPKPPPPPKLQPMEPDPGIAKRAQGAQQVISGILADPSLIDPRRRQGLLA